MGALKKSGVLCRVNGGIGGHGERVNGGIEKGQWGSGGIGRGIEKGQWRHWSGSMGVLKRVNGVNGGIEKDQWRHWSGSMGVLKRVNGGIGQGQWW